MNSAALAVVNDDQVDEILEVIRRIDEINKEVGIRAFVWDVLKSV